MGGGVVGLLGGEGKGREGEGREVVGEEDSRV